jgi:drug/metabolite transporter (DMT)-like permease
LPEDRRSLQTALALGALYVIWGTTYFGIKEAVAHIPPLLMASSRFLVPAAVIYALCRARGQPRPAAIHWRRGFLVGGLMLTVGNGVVSLVETRMPSGVTALIVAMVPVWTALMEWLVERRRPNAYVAASLLLGTAGVALLSREGGGWPNGVEPVLVVVLLASGSGWALGSILSRRTHDRPASTWMDLALQMAGGGLLLAVAGAVHGELPQFHPLAVPVTAWLWVAYLSVFGSVVALGCYLWLLRTTTPAVATTYAFVNPAVAVFVGWAAGGETVTAITVAAAVLIIGAVAIIVWSKSRKPAAAPAAA